MADLPLTSATVSLAGRAAELSMDLSCIQERCGHGSTSSDISSIASELNLLSTTLWRLHEAMVADVDSYTASFNEDLAEILGELKMVFEEISECCTALQKADTPTHTVVWLFKKGKVHHLQKHLAALKTTLLVMRTVLWHGREYVVQSPESSSEPESILHTMHEDRVIIESVLSQNRDAIIDLNNLDLSNSVQCQRSPSKMEGGGRPGHFYSSGVDIPPIPDVPPATAITESPSPRRSFSKRGVRLGVHMSILDMGAHDAPDRLKNKWIQTSRSHQYQPRYKKSRASFNGGHALSKISEVDATVGKPSLEDISNLAISTSPDKEKSMEASKGRHSRRHSLSQGVMAGPIGKGLYKMKEAAEKLKPRGGRRSLTQEELEMEIENYGSV